MAKTQVQVEVVKLTDLTPDDQNANQGTLRGEQLLNSSLERLGAGRSVLLDRNGKLIAGNKTQGRAVDLGFEDAIVVHTDGTKIVAVMRDDLDLDEPGGKARELAIADNRVGEVNLAWDAKALKVLQETAPDALGNYFHPEEVERLIKADETQGDTKDSSTDTGNEDFPDLGDEQAFWPEIKVRVHPDAFARYEDLQARVDDPTEGERLGHILEIAETALDRE